jgi:hypothetical protein
MRLIDRADHIGLSLHFALQCHDYHEVSSRHFPGQEEL